MEVGKFCKDFDGFVAKYGLTMFFFQRNQRRGNFWLLLFDGLKESKDKNYTCFENRPQKKIASIPQTGSFYYM